MSEPGQLLWRAQPFDDDPDFGPGRVNGRVYESPFGPFDVAQTTEMNATVVRSPSVGTAVLEWGLKSVGNSDKALREAGLTGRVGQVPFRVSVPSGLLPSLLSRDRRALIFEMSDRPLRRLLLREFSTVSLEGPDETQLVTWREGHVRRGGYRKGGQVSPGADASDLALTLLAVGAHLHNDLGLGLGSLLGGI